MTLFPPSYRKSIPILLVMLLLTLLAPARALAKTDAPVVSSFQLLTSPTLGGQCGVIWAGIPQITPRAATITFTLRTPDGKITSATQPLALVSGKTSDATWQFATRIPGTYRIEAALTMFVSNGRYAQTSVLNVVIPAQGKPYLAKEPVLSAKDYAGRAPLVKRVAAASRNAPRAAATAAFTISGAFHYTDKPFDQTGFTGTRLAPIRRATLTVLETNGGVSTTTLGSTLTADDGSFSYTVPASSSAGTGRDLLIQLTTVSPVAEVDDLGARPYFFEIPVVQWQGGALNLGTTDFAVAQSGPWNIFDDLTQGSDFIKGVAGTTPPQVHAVWAVGNSTGTYFLPYLDTIFLLGKSDDPDEFDDAVILHEYGHFVASHFSYDKSPGGQHAWTSHISPQLAWSEGWATFFSSAVRNSPIYFDSNDWGGMVLDIEIPTDSVTGDDNEGAVAASLWDIFDTHNDNKDTLSDGFANIYYVIHNFFDYRRACTIRDFYDGWVISKRGHNTEMQAILDEHGITYPPIIVISMSINNEAAVTQKQTVTLNNECVGSPVSYMASETADFKGAAWQPYSTAPIFNLAAGNGNRGVYFKVKDAAGNESSPVEDSIILGTVPITPLVINGPQVAASISNEFDYDLYSFTITTAGDYTIDTADYGLTDSYMQLYGPNSQTKLLDYNDDGHGSIDYMSRLTRPFQPGTYYVKLTGFTTSTGDYHIWVYAGSPAPTIPLLKVNGPILPGAIDFSSSIEENWFRLDITTPGPYTIRTIEDTLYDTRMELFGPNSQSALLEQDDDGGKTYMSMISRTLQPGTYYIRITSYSQNISGKYKIYAYPGLYGQVRPLAVNAPATDDTILSSTDFNWFSFNVTIPGTYAIETTSGTLKDSYLFLYGPNTQETFIVENNDTDQGTMAAIHRDLVPGVYYFKVEGFRPSDTGSYHVRVRTDIQAASLPASGSWNKGTLAASGDINWFKFTVNTPMGYTIDTGLSAGGGLTDSVLTLYGPDNPLRLIAQNDDAGPKVQMSSLTVFLQPGTYYVLVNGYSNKDVGDYCIRLTPRPMAPATPVAVNAAPTLAAISFSTDVDWYSFTVPTAGNYVVETLPGTLKGGYIRVFGPGNQVVLAGQDGGASRTGCCLMNLAPGTYYARVQGFTPANLGTYTIQVRTEVMALRLEAPAVPRTLATANDAHWFSFTVGLPGAYTFSTQPGTLTDGYLRLFGPNGRDALLAQDHNSGQKKMPMITCNLAPGTYYLKFQGYQAKDVGTYSITAQRALSKMAIDASWSKGSLDIPGEIDWYAFVVTQAGTYTIDTRADTLTDNYLRLYGPNTMSILKAQDDNSGAGNMGQITRSLAPGIYYVMVNGRTSVNIGSYQIQVRSSH